MELNKETFTIPCKYHKLIYQVFHYHKYSCYDRDNKRKQQLQDSKIISQRLLFSTRPHGIRKLQEENTMFTKMLRNYLEMLERNSEKYFAEKSETVSAFYCMAD